MPALKNIGWDEVFYERNLELGLDPCCHECSTHCSTGGGYKTIRREGKQWRLHRYIWYCHTGYEPEVVMHLCDNPKCVNVAHLKAGTFLDNNRDRDLKGRMSRTLTTQNCKLSNEAVIAIREALKNGVMQKDLAVQFGVSKPVICRIAANNTYKDV